MKALRIILASIKKADIDFNLIKEGSKICIGVSGGKDSMALFYCLHLYKRYSSTKFEIYPMVIDLGFPNSNFDKLKKYIDSYGYNLHVEDAKTVYQILSIQKERQNLKHLPCSICSKMKKAVINKVAINLGCDTVSFAHHRNDAIETLFLNEIYGGRIATFAPKMYLSNDKINFIRPFIYVEEKVIKRLIKEENIPVFPSNCPNDGHTERENIKQIVNSFNKEFPPSIDNFLTMLVNPSKIDIFSDHYEHKIEFTPLTSKTVDDISSYLDEVKFLKNSDTKKEEKHIHIYKDDKLFGVIKLLENDRKYTINLLKLLKLDYLEFIIYDLYNVFYTKHNPIEFYLNLENEYLKEIKNIPFEVVKKGRKHSLIEIKENPAKIFKKLKLLLK